MTVAEMIDLARQMAASANVNESLVCGICDWESKGWNPWAIRYEPDFYSRYIVKLGLPDWTEARARAISWGLMQVMGETAREEGFIGPLPSLCDPAVGIERGLVHLKRMLVRSGGNIPITLNLYNGGANPNYAADVQERMKKYA